MRANTQDSEMRPSSVPAVPSSPNPPGPALSTSQPALFSSSTPSPEPGGAPGATQARFSCPSPQLPSSRALQHTTSTPSGAQAYFQRNNGLEITHEGIKITNTFAFARTKQEEAYLLYAFVEYQEQDNSRKVLALPVFENLDSRHASFSLFLKIPKERLVKGGEVLIHKPADTTTFPRIIAWTDKTQALYQTMYLHDLRLNGYTENQIDELCLNHSRDSREALQLIKEAAQRVPNHFSALPAELFVNHEDWGQVLGSHPDQSVFTHRHGTSIYNDFLERSSNVYHLKPYVIAPEKIGQLSLNALVFAHFLAQLTQEHFVSSLRCFREAPEEINANALFASLG